MGLKLTVYIRSARLIMIKNCSTAIRKENNLF